MPLTYTTAEAIARRLRGRLRIPTATMNPMQPPANITQQTVDPDLIEDVASQVENKIDMILGQIYEMPLANKHPILAGIVERLVVADIMLTHFQSSSSPELGGDAGFGQLMYKKAQEDLAMLVAGHNIALAGVPTPPTSPGIMTPQPIVLPNERLRIVAPDTITRNYTIIGGSRFQASESTRSDWGITWDSRGRARDADRLWD